MINHEIKSQLAKLLATEDLVVENKQVETACFNVHTRVLTLPIWDRASGEVYDLLVGHEVGHALFTPDIDWSLDNTRLGRYSPLKNCPPLRFVPGAAVLGDPGSERGRLGLVAAPLVGAPHPAIGSRIFDL